LAKGKVLMATAFLGLVGAEIKVLGKTIGRFLVYFQDGFKEGLTRTIIGFLPRIIIFN